MKKNLRVMLAALAAVLALVVAVSERDAWADEVVRYGRIYSLQNGWNNYGGGYLDTDGSGCQGNNLCVSTAGVPWRDKQSGNWQILSATGKPLGSPVLVGDSVHLVNQYNGSYLDTDGSGCQGDQLCVSTATSSNRDSGSGTWRIRTGAFGTPVTEGMEVHFQNGYANWTGGYLNTHNTGCQGNLMCVATSTLWDRDGSSGHWKFAIGGTPSSRADSFCYNSGYSAQDILANDTAKLTWDQYGNLTLTNFAQGAAPTQTTWGIGSSVPLTGSNAAQLCFNAADSRLKIIASNGTVAWSSSSTTDSAGTPRYDTGYAVAGGTLSLTSCTLAITQGSDAYWQSTTPSCNQVTLTNHPQLHDQCWSYDGNYHTILSDPDHQLELAWTWGTLWLLKDGDVAWNLTYNLPSGSVAQQLCLQTDGNLVISDTAGNPLWTTGSNSASAVTMGLDGTCALTFSNGDTQVKRVATGTCDQTSIDQGWCRSTGASGSILETDSTHLDWTSDGHLELFAGTSEIWNATNQVGSKVCFQGDGNLVIYSSAGTALWASGTSGSGMQLNLSGCSLTMIDAYKAALCSDWAAGGLRSCLPSPLQYCNNGTCLPNFTPPPGCSHAEAVDSHWAHDYCSKAPGVYTPWSFSPASCLASLPGGGFSYVKDLKSGNSSFGAELWVVAAAVNGQGLSALESSVASYDHPRSAVLSDVPSSQPPANYLEALADTGVAVTLFGSNTRVMELNGYVESLNGPADSAALFALGTQVYPLTGSGVANWSVTHEFFSLDQTYWIEFIPVSVHAGVTGEVGANVNLYADSTTFSASNKLTATITPYGSLDFDTSTGLGPEGASVGIEGTVNIVRLSLPITQSVTFSSKQYTSKLDFAVSTLAGSLDLYAELGPFKATKNIASFDGYSTSTNLLNLTGSF